MYPFLYEGVFMTSGNNQLKAKETLSVNQCDCSDTMDASLVFNVDFNVCTVIHLHRQ